MYSCRRRRRASFKRSVAVFALLTFMTAAVPFHRTCVGFSPFPRNVRRANGYSLSTQCFFRRTHSQCFASRQDESNLSSDASLPMNVTGITLKMAFDTNWAVADNAETTSERFTSPQSLDLVHRLRRECDAVLVGRSTVERDNCTLTVRRVPTFQKKQPIRIVVDPNLRLLQDDKNDYALFQDGLETIVYCKDGSLNHDLEIQPEITLVPLPPSGSDKYLSVVDIVKDLNDNRRIHHVMVEGGPATALQFLHNELVDRAIMIRAPVEFSEPVESGMSTETLTNAGLELLGTSMSDGDVVEYWSRPDLSWPTRDCLTEWP